MQHYLPIVRDDTATAALYQEHAQAIFTYLRMHTPTREDAEDLLIEVFLAALEYEHFLEVPRERQRAWLWRVAQNKAIDLHRRGKRRLASRLERVVDALYFDEEQGPEQSALRSERYAALRERVRGLPELQRQILHLRFVNGLRSAEIAQILGKREGAVRTILSRTLNALRSTYEHL